MGRGGRDKENKNSTPPFSLVLFFFFFFFFLSFAFLSLSSFSRRPVLYVLLNDRHRQMKFF